MNLAYVLLLSSAIVVTQLLVGGTRLVYCLPGYALLALAAVLSIFSVQRPRAPASGWCLGVTAVVFTYLLARAAFSPVDYLWWMDFYQMIACLIVYLLTALYVTERGPRLAIISVLLALAVVEVFFGLRQFTGGDNWMPFGFTRADYASRASGTLVSSIHFAGYLEAVGIFALALGFWGAWPVWARLLISYTGLLCYLGVALSGSRGGYASSVFSVVVFIMLSLWVLRKVRPQRFLGTTLLAGLACLVIFGGAYTLMNKSNLLRQRLELIGKKDVRIYNWQAALDQFRLAPVLGTGAGTHLYYSRYFRRAPLQADPIHAHSDYLEMLAEYGLIGLLGMLAIIIFHVDGGLRSLASLTRDELLAPRLYGSLRSNALALNIGAICAVAAYVAHSVVDFNLHIPGNALTLAFIFGLLATPPRENRPPEIEENRGSLPFPLALPALGLWMGVTGLPKFPGEYWCERARIAMYYHAFPAAGEFAQKALRVQTRNPDIHYLLAGAWAGPAAADPNPLARRASFESAVAACRASLQLFPQNEHALMRLARVLDEANRFREAGEAYRAAIALDPALGSLRAYYARHLARVGRVENARDEAQRARALGASIDPDTLTKDTILNLPLEP